MFKLTEISVQYISPVKDKIKITSSKSAYELFIKHWNLNTIELQEEIKVLLLNRSNSVLGIYELSKGGTAGTVVDLKLLFSVALKCVASSIILAHNHPSGNTNPSTSDIELTNKIKQGSEILDIKLIDHLIIAKDGYYSFADEGKL